jgi:glucokinase
VTLAAGIDVGGTKCLGVVVDGAGTIVRSARRPTPHGGDAVIDTLVELAGALRPWDTLGVGVPGLVTRAGVLRAAPNLTAVRELPVGPALSQRLGTDVAVDNDATAACAAEWRLGSGRGVSDLVMVTLGTGIGGGLVLDGRLRRGVNGFAGEIGHMVVDPDGPPCVCGRRGCWERYASGSGLAALGRDAAVAGQLEAIMAGLDGDAAAIRGEHLVRALRAGDEQAGAVVDRFAWWVALGLANLTNLLDPARIVLGGGFAVDADLFLPPVRRWFGQILYSPDLRPHPDLVFAALGEHAGAIGSALMPELHR